MCAWHALLKSSPAEQQAAAQRRLVEAMGREGYEMRPRIPRLDWPDGERWCSGCQSFVPLFYASGSRCRACNGAAAHAAHVEKTYGITGEDYDALFELQGGCCYICRRRPKTKRLAVDHDHETNEVRGLLCADSERGCNMAVVGGLSTARDGALAAARRAVEYLERPPYQRLKAQAILEEFRESELVGPATAPQAVLDAQNAAQEPPAAPPAVDVPDWML